MTGADEGHRADDSDAKLQSAIANEMGRQATYEASATLSEALRGKPKGEGLSASELQQVEAFLEAGNWLPALTAARVLEGAQQLDEAERILLRSCDATEQDAAKNDWGVAPAAYERLAKLYRRQKRFDAEVAILERFERQSPSPGAGPGRLSERLENAKALLAQARGHS